MKWIHKIIAALIAGAFLFSACEKAEKLPFFADGVAPVLTASATTVAPPPADSNRVVLKLTWTDPKHTQDSSKYKFVIELDSTNRNFARAHRIELIGKREYEFIAKELNTILLNWGFQFNVAYDVDIRVTSSYGNNNEQKRSNVVKVRMTPYKIPPKVPLPTTGRLFIVGGATDGGWNNPVPLPAQELARIDETTFGGIFNLQGGQAYLLLPVNGSWDEKYALPNASLPNIANGGPFAYYGVGVPGGSDFPSPAASGLYKITVDFQQGVFSVEPFTQQHGLPTNLYIVGGATPGGWNNPVPVPQQQLTRRNSVQWDITINLQTGQDYLILPTNGSWDRKFGTDDRLRPNSNLGGRFVPEGQDFVGPPTTGLWKFSIDFFTGTYKLTQ
ncbi:MAG: SusE domain-containing protein [Lacibacter sp.]